MDVTEDWFWEGNVVDKIARHLERGGWSIIATADTRSKARGIDLHAAKSGKEIILEAKGYPSKNYRDPARATEQKPTNPTSQAQQWYSHALLTAMRLQTKYPGAIVALGLPDFPRYRSLFAETQNGLSKLGVSLLFVSQNGEVETWGCKV